jgi:hypothetical protein
MRRATAARTSIAQQRGVPVQPRGPVMKFADAPKVARIRAVPFLRLILPFNRKYAPLRAIPVDSGIRY